MIQKCSLIRVMGVFFREPTKIHFIREISREIGLAQTSVRNHLKELRNSRLIVNKESYPFDGYVADRDNEDFIFYKQAFNYYSLGELRKKIIDEVHPKAIVIFGSYSKGEDIESSDIDVLVVSKVRKKIDLKKIESKLGREINILFVKGLDDLDEAVRRNILNGWVIYGVI